MSERNSAFKWREWDSSHPPLSQVLAWIRRLQFDHYCGMDDNFLCTCRCIGWDGGHTMYRFWLCGRAKPKHYLAFRKVFEDGKKFEFVC